LTHLVLCRLDDICSRAAVGRQEPHDRQLAVSVGVLGAVQRPLGRDPSGADVPVVARSHRRPEAPEAVHCIEAK